MDIEALRNTPKVAALPSDHFKALWYDLHNDWEAAHSIVQQMSDMHAMWIHAYLHRKEPDIWNAKYWYRKADKAYHGDIPFEKEVKIILENLTDKFL